MKMVIGYWSLVISKEAETKKGRRETVSRKLVWLFVICDLEFGILLIYRFLANLAVYSSKTKKIRQRIVISHWSLGIGHWSLVQKVVINTTPFLIHEFKKSNKSCHFLLKKL